MKRLVSPGPMLAVVAVLTASALACGGRTAQTQHTNAALEEELKRVDEALDRVEERLLASKSSVSLWDELRDRHASASAVTCENLSTHAAAIASSTVNQREKRQARTKNRLASRVVVSETASR